MLLSERVVKVSAGLHVYAVDPVVEVDEGLIDITFTTVREFGTDAVVTLSAAETAVLTDALEAIEAEALIKDVFDTIGRNLYEARCDA